MSEYFLADDLSGALDAAAAFRAAGWRVTIAWSRDAWPAAQPGEIVGFSTETRNATPAAAAATVSAMLAHARQLGARLLYKKIDSTLRGQVAAELGVVMAALPESRVLFTPANPRVGRTVRDGQLLVRGVPVTETEFARDPQSPVRESLIAKLLGDVAASGQVRIADVDTEADLDTAVAQAAAQPGLWFAVGSGALARPVAAFWAASRSGLNDSVGSSTSSFTFTSPSPIPASVGPTLFICGSAHPANRAQSAALARRMGLPLHEISVASDTAVATSPSLARIEQLTRSLHERGAVALLLESTRRDPALALVTIASTAAAVIAQAGVTRVFVTGGETAFALCGALKVTGLTVEREIEPGLVLAETVGARRLWLAVKPGGFGDEETWLRGWRALGGVASA